MVRYPAVPNKAMKEFTNGRGAAAIVVCKHLSDPMKDHPMITLDKTFPDTTVSYSQAPLSRHYFTGRFHIDDGCFSKHLRHR